jgi:hypothetical protein
MQCFAGSVSIMASFLSKFKPKSDEEITRTTLLQVEQNITYINLKITQLTGEKKKYEDQLDLLIKETYGNPTAVQREEMQQLLWKVKDSEKHMSNYRMKLSQAQKQESTVRGYLFSTDNVKTQEQIADNIGYLTRKYDPDRMHDVLDRSDERFNQLDTWNEEQVARTANSRTREMDVSSELEKKLAAAQDQFLLNAPNASRYKGSSAAAYERAPLMTQKEDSEEESLYSTLG